MTTITDVYTVDRCPEIELYPDVIAEESTGPQVTRLPHVWPGTSSCVVVAWPERVKGAIGPERMGALGSATRHSYAPPEQEQQTSATTRSGPMLLLEKSARLGDRRAFAAWSQAVDWTTRQPDELTTAIDLALSLEMADLAVELAQLGRRLFPDHERLQRAAQVLAPPVVRVVRAPRAGGIDASRTWLREHAPRYRGQWVAVREGKLLGAAASLEELMPVIGEGEDASRTIVTKVL